MVSSVSTGPNMRISQAGHMLRRTPGVPASWYGRAVAVLPQVLIWVRRWEPEWFVVAPRLGVVGNAAVGLRLLFRQEH